MKIFTMISLLVFPVGAQAMGMRGVSSAAGCGAPGIGAHFATALYAVLAVIGYWALQHASKEAANYVKRAGQIVGWVLIVAGLLGVLCGAASHAGKAKSRQCRGSYHYMGMLEPGETGKMHVMESGHPVPDEVAKKPSVPKKK